MTEDRSIELEVEVGGTPKEVWAAIATGQGISSWYVPHRIEEVEGGEASASFGPGMDVAGRVTQWDPPRRFSYKGIADGPQLAFEWQVETRRGGRCVVRLINAGFGTGTEWDDHFEAMTEGWRTFLTNLQLHLAEFGGRTAAASLPMASWETTPAEAWNERQRRSASIPHQPKATRSNSPRRRPPRWSAPFARRPTTASLSSQPNQPMEPASSPSRARVHL